MIAYFTGCNMKHDRDLQHCNNTAWCFSSAEPRRSSFHNKRPSGWHRGHCQSGGMWGDSVEKITDLVKRGLAEASRRSKQLSDFLFPRPFFFSGLFFTICGQVVHTLRQRKSTQTQACWRQLMQRRQVAPRLLREQVTNEPESWC